MLSRRGLIEGGAALAGVALAGRGFASASASASAVTTPPRPNPGYAQARSRRAAEVRSAAASLESALPEPSHLTNGDETALPGMIACYSKGLPHSPVGEVDGAAYALLLHALDSGNPADFEAIPLGGFVKLANPQAGLAFNLVGPDPARVKLAPPPRFAGAEQGAELVELYWQALLRDVPFAEYDSHPLARRGRRRRVTPATLFRGGGACLNGPYL